MLVTDRFIIINFPKTGSTFVRRALKRLHGHRTKTLQGMFASLFADRTAGPLQVLKFPNIRYRNENYGKPDEHGIYCQIPDDLLKGRDIVSVFRNPFEWYISAYLYGYWRTATLLHADEAMQEYPHFPNLSFKEFVLSRTKYMIPTMHPDIPISGDIGVLTVQFIHFFFKNPETTLRNIDRWYIDSNMYLEDMPDIRFLRTESLNNDLYRLLKDYGYSSKAIAFLLKARAANTKRKQGDTEDSYYDDELRQFVLQKERLLFKLFPEYLPQSTSQFRLNQDAKSY